MFFTSTVAVARPKSKSIEPSEKTAENEKYLPEQSNQIRLVGFDRENSEYDEDREYFTDIMFITEGENEIIQSRFEKEIYDYPDIHTTLGHSFSLSFKDNRLNFWGVNTTIDELQKLICSVKDFLAILEKEEREKEEAISAKKLEFETKINNLQF